MKRSLLAAVAVGALCLALATPAFAVTRISGTVRNINTHAPIKGAVVATGKIKVKNTLAVEGFKNIWALGDCALVPEPFTDGFCPPTAQHAIRQGKTVAHNIVSSMRGGSQLAFDFGGLGKMGSLGHHCAVADIMGLNISGFLVKDGFYGIKLDHVQGCSISNNTVIHCTQPGIALLYSDGNTVVGNNASFNGIVGEGWYGIYLSNSNHNLIAGNEAYGNGDYGINLFPSCRNNGVAAV